ncbi:hypothetical protein [Streptomyces noursei]|uniref:Uncharacterized protein n=1 Tax=Streptomyces noursei TaxID=1971 RepID=A0A2N8PN81_STRNR|nr:hypothetical protein [Streptomyces noursei]PNE42460.1 hypothetical protein AOB60_18580 [Streptomyces noursei]
MPTNIEETTTPNRPDRPAAPTDAPHRTAPATATGKEPPHDAPAATRLLAGIVWTVLLLTCWLCGGHPGLPDNGPARFPATGDAAAVGRPTTHAPPPRPATPDAHDPAPQHD